MEFKNVNELIEHLNSLGIEEDIILFFSSVKEHDITNIKEDYVRYDKCVKSFRKFFDVFGEYDSIRVYGYTKLSEVIMVHQHVKGKVSI